MILFTSNQEELMKTSIILLTHNQIDYTKKCIESIRNHTHLDYEIIVVDNGSEDETVAYLSEQEDITVIENKENEGFAKGNNQGVEKATGETILFLNNDTVVTPGWLESLINTLYSSEKIGIAGPVSNNISGNQCIPVTYNQETLDGLEDFASEYLKKKTGEKKKVLRLVGFALACKKKVLDAVGLFDESFGIGNYEDDDLCLRALREGYELYIAQDSFIHHFGSVTFKNSPINFNQLMYTNKSKLIEKWGFNANYYMFSRPEVLNLIPNHSKRVLELGCGMGAMAIDLKEKYNCEVIGIEIDSSVAEFAKHNLDTVYSADVEDFDLSKLGTFDCIVCADVLEHLRDPWKIVKELTALLNDGGQLVISLPNIANIEIIKELMQADFSYRDAGLLDRTHLRFFTRKTLHTLFPENLVIKILSGTTIAYSEADHLLAANLGHIGKSFSLDTDSLSTDAFIYQFLIVAEKV